MSKRLLYIVVSLSVIVGSCSNEVTSDKKDVKDEFYENGAMRSSVHLKNGLKDGYSFYYYPNGKFKSIQYYKLDTANGDFLWFYEDGRLKSYAKYQDNARIFDMQYDGNGNIYKSSTFMCIESQTDTLELGDTYSSDIFVNFWMPGFTCEIFKRKVGGDTSNVIYEKIGNAPQATYSITPTEIGEHTYEVSILQKKYFPNSDSIQDFRRSAYNGKYWVTSKK